MHQITFVCACSESVLRLSFSVIGFKFYRFYRITRELKNPKCYPHWEVNPGNSDTSGLQVLHATPQLTPLFAGSLSPLDSYVVMLY